MTCNHDLKTASTRPFTRPHRKCDLLHVEKHLGSAWVLIGEVGEGACHHRPLAIGHLHQAEQLAWEWPGLCKSIRAARYRYQKRGMIPDFVALVQIVHFHMSRQQEAEATES